MIFISRRNLPSMQTGQMKPSKQNETEMNLIINFDSCSCCDHTTCHSYNSLNQIARQKRVPLVMAVCADLTGKQ
jgi:hypothetical protein